MSTRRFLAMALVLALASSGLSASAATAGPTAPVPAHRSLRASVDPAVATVSLPGPKKGDGIRKTATDNGGGGGGGGGATMLFLVLGLAGSAAATYFIIKETKKQTGQTQ